MGSSFRCAMMRLILSSVVSTSSSVASPSAALIAAAPDLLALARICLAEWDKDCTGVLKGELIARLSQYSHVAREVIEKAEGKKWLI